MRPVLIPLSMTAICFFPAPAFCMAFVAHKVSKHELPARFAVISARLDSHILSLAGTIDFRALAVHQALTAEPLAFNAATFRPSLNYSIGPRQPCRILQEHAWGTSPYSPQLPWTGLHCFLSERPDTQPISFLRPALFHKVLS